MGGAIPVGFTTGALKLNAVATPLLPASPAEAALNVIDVGGRSDALAGGSSRRAPLAFPRKTCLASELQARWTSSGGASSPQDAPRACCEAGGCGGDGAVAGGALAVLPVVAGLNENLKPPFPSAGKLNGGALGCSGGCATGLLAGGSTPFALIERVKTNVSCEDLLRRHSRGTHDHFQEPRRAVSLPSMNLRE